MKEKIKFIILIVVFLVLLFSINKILENNSNNLNISNENEIEVTNSQVNETKDITQNEDVVENIETNENVSVIEVTESTFDEEVLKSDKTVLIDFYADWCGPCKILSPIVEEVAKENPDLKVVKIDVDSNSKLSYEYGAYSIPTLVVIKDGKEINRAVGAIPKASILELVK